MDEIVVSPGALDQRGSLGPVAHDAPFSPDVVTLAPHTASLYTPGPESPALLAPWFHTVGIVLLLLLHAFVAHLSHYAPNGGNGVSRIASDTAKAIAEIPKVPLYLSTIMLSWMLLASVVAGLYRRRAFFFATLHRRFASRWADPAIGLAIYLGFLAAISLTIMGLTVSLMVRMHVAHARAAHSATQTQSASSATPAPSKNTSMGGEGTAAKTQDTQNADDAAAVRQRVEHLLHMNRGAVAALAPHSLPELLLWTLLSFTAGFCEEHIFRGYLLAQSLGSMRRLALSPWLAKTLSVLATSVLFGSLHLYEGVGGAVAVGLLGVLFAVMTLVLGNLRAVIVAHFLQDFLGGLAYYIGHLRHAV